MLYPNRRMMPAIVAGALGMSGALAWAAEPNQQELQDQIKALQAKVAALETRQSASPEQTAAQDVLRDSNSRSQLMAVEGFTAGYTPDRGFVIQDAAGNFSLNPYLQFQARYVGDYREKGKRGDSSDYEDGFEVRRMKFGFQGNVFGPDLTYQFQWASDRNGGSPVLEEAWAQYRFADAWAVKGGQFKDPVFHEQLVSSTKQLAADRSLLNNILENNDNYVQGISLIYESGPIRAQGAVTDGFGSQDTGWENPPAVGGFAADWGVAARVEYLLMGNWKQYSDFTALNNNGDLLVIGGGADLTQFGRLNALWHTVDVQWEPQAIKGLAVYGAYVGRYGWLNDAPAGLNDNAYDYGVLVQAGFLLNPQWEVFGRYDYTHLDENDPQFAVAANIQKDIHEITGGVNYYLHGHNAKFTADLTYLPKGSPIAASGLGILGQNSDDAQVVARVQFQLAL